MIDTKYYKEAFSTRYKNKKIDSGNLYQLFSYLKNQETESDVTKNCECILLSPAIENDFEYNYRYEGHRIRVKSIDLNQDWRQIRDDLLRIVA